MKKIICISIILIIISFIPIIHQEITTCSVFGYDHLISPKVITSADSCSTSILSSLLIPGVQLSRVFHFNSVYLNYFLITLFNFVFYIVLGKLILLIAKNKYEK